MQHKPEETGHDPGAMGDHGPKEKRGKPLDLTNKIKGAAFFQQIRRNDG